MKSVGYDPAVLMGIVEFAHWQASLFFIVLRDFFGLLLTAGAGLIDACGRRGGFAAENNAWQRLGPDVDTKFA
jgi:hypothetical protein